MDELVAGAFHTKLCLRITQNSHPPAQIECFIRIDDCIEVQCRQRKSPLDVTKGTKKSIVNVWVFLHFLQNHILSFVF